MSTELLKFGIGNAKLGKAIHTFALPSGYTCPGALKCLAFADRKTGMIRDGSKAGHRCFMASIEAYSKTLRPKVWRNFRLLKLANGEDGMADLIERSLPASARIVRVHVGGDFFSREYFNAWMRVARRRPDVRFYAYTKSLVWWVSSLIPENFHLTASEGGKHDALIQQYGLKTARVVFSIEEAAALGLEIDHDDNHAYDGASSFALLIHGTQPAGSAASKAKAALKGIGSYSRQKAA
jgi:Gene product 88